MIPKQVTFKNIGSYWMVYLLLLLPLTLTLIFDYHTFINGMVHMFYRWDGNTVEEFIGLENFRKLFHDKEFIQSILVVVILTVANVFKMIVPITVAVILHHIRCKWAAGFYRMMLVIPMIVPVMVTLLMWKYFYEPHSGLLNILLRDFGILARTDSIQWLTDPYLVILSLIFMGFPWVGVFGVLIYLAGLQKIDPGIYEAAELDGAGGMCIFWRIELPMLMTQVRINLILMVIDTVQSWENIYLFLGPDGGPGGIATVPGLLIFRQAFSNGLFGYGCAIGFVIFAVTLILTFINDKFIRLRRVK